MPSQQPRKTKRLRESVTRADLMILARAVDQSIAEVRQDLQKLQRLVVNPPPSDCACGIIHSGPCPSDKTFV